MTKIIENVRMRKPLIHNITNYVTVNDVANMVLACGASPIMADDQREAEDITSICNGLNINIGTLNERTIQSMILAGKRANALNHPVLLDPVGAGASKLRTETALALMEKIQFSAIKGNISEIKTLSLGSGSTKGVDADIADAVTDENLEQTVAFVKTFARSQKCVVVVTGAIDLVTDGDSCYAIRNGHAMMEKITGTGCQLGGMMTAYITANPEHVLEAAVTAVCAMGVAGEIAYKNLKPEEGNATYRNRIIDSIYHMTDEMIELHGKCEKIS